LARTLATPLPWSRAKARVATFYYLSFGIVGLFILHTTTPSSCNLIDALVHSSQQKKNGFILEAFYP